MRICTVLYTRLDGYNKFELSLKGVVDEFDENVLKLCLVND